MAAPLKPWERPGVNNYQANSPIPSNSMAGLPTGIESVHSAAAGSSSSISLNSSSPPQIPPRPSQQSSYVTNTSRIGTGYGYGGPGGYSGYGGCSGLGGYGGMYSSPYSTYGGYGGINRFNDVQSSFARHAEESSRPAFQSIESIVTAVSSVGMMLDSTFQAVYNSFRAVIGVADNFSRLKEQLFQVVSALAFIRTLKYFVRRFLELIRMLPHGEAEREWKRAFAQAASGPFPDGGGPKKSSWPILMFFGIIMGGPYLIWRLISAFSGPNDEKSWAKGEEDHFVAKANYNFEGQSPDELSFTAGQMITVAPKELQPQVRGWLLASVDGVNTGTIPANYVSVLGKKRGTKHMDNPQQQPTAQPALPVSQTAQGSVSSEFEGAFSNVTPSNSVNELLNSTQNTFNQDVSPDAFNLEAAEILNKADEL